MNFTSEDIDRGYKECTAHGCEKLHILEAGADYENWLQCDKCNSWVVDVNNE